MFKNLKNKIVVNRKQEEDLYAFVASEMSQGVKNTALWLKALELANGNTERQTSQYIKLRVQALKDDIHIIKNISSEIEELRSESFLDTTFVQNVKEVVDIDGFMVLIESDISLTKTIASVSDMSKTDLKALINTADSCDQYPIHNAIKQGRRDLVEWLIAMGAKVDSTNFWGSTPMELALKNDDVEMIKLLKIHSD